MTWKSMKKLTDLLNIERKRFNGLNDLIFKDKENGSCRGCGPKTPRHCAPPAVTVLSHSFWRLFELLRRILGTCRLPYTIYTTTKDRSIAQAGGETHGHANTHAATLCCSHTGENFPNSVNHRTIQMVQCIAPDATSNLAHYLASVYSNDHRWVLAKQLTGTQL